MTVTLPLSYIQQLRREGADNLSEGIRWLVEHARTEAGDFWYRKEEAEAPPTT